MNETLQLALAGGAGGLFGAIFFGGLWWTVRKGIASQRPALWFFGSLLVRMSIVLTGFYFVAGGHWERLLACTFGFFIARFIVTARLRAPLALQAAPSQTGPPVGSSIVQPREANHAP